MITLLTYTRGILELIEIKKQILVSFTIVLPPRLPVLRNGIAYWWTVFIPSKVFSDPKADSSFSDSQKDFSWSYIAIS